ncbi:unnamed protein product [Blepharisma stoltei]|uniref:Tectonic domain-containing protein n=1 Tax=Blepharisma stoltei TaxID=1481888 RepID=A0AAU9IQN0_9CILI|nr:unnamed protein product [Blepharisma stoltei]
MKFWVFILALYFSKASESNDISSDEDPGTCVCDLTKNSCDAFCCCDDDCTSAVIQMWEGTDSDSNMCVRSRFGNSDRFSCIDDSEVYKINSRRGLKKTDDSSNDLICVTVDNAQPFGSFHTLVSEASTSKATDRIDLTVGYSDVIYAPKPTYSWYRDYQVEVNVTSNETTTGVKTITQTQTFVYLTPGVVMGSEYSGWAHYHNRWTIPGPDSYGLCNDMNTIQWLYKANPGPCTRAYTGSTFQSICVSSLSIATYMDYLQIVPGATNETTTSINYYQIYKRDTSTNTQTLIPITTLTTTFDSTNCICKNAFLEAHYTVWTNNKQNATDQIYATVVIADLSLSSCTSTAIGNVTQQFSVKFLTTSGLEQKRSGNPGYVKGKPVLAGTLSDKVISQFDDGIQLYGASSKGACISSSSTPVMGGIQSLNFGQDAVYSCYLEYTLSQLETACTTSNLQMSIFSYQDIAYIGIFGDADANTLSDWVAVNTDAMANPTAEFNSTSKTCKLPNLVSYDIFYTETGDLTNPQPKIVYVKKSVKNNPWEFKKQQSGDTQIFLNTVVFSFIEYTEKYDPYGSPPLDPIKVMPDDVIYPFRYSSGSYFNIFLGICICLII